MATISKSVTLVPSGYTGLTSLTTTSSYPVSNGYDGTDSTTYARLSLSTSTTGYLYFTFDTSEIPADAVITSVTARARVRVSSTSRVTSTQCQLFTGTTAKGSNVTFASTSSTNIVTLTTGTWSRSELNDLRMKIGGTGSSSSQSKYIYFYGAEVVITYSVSASTVTSTLQGNGTISPSGAENIADGSEYTLTIVPDNENDTVTASKDGTNITSSLVLHNGASDSVSTVPGSDFETGFSDSNANFYRSSSSTGTTWLQYAIGHSAESPYSSDSSHNTYVKDNNNNTAIGWIEFPFDFSDIPVNAVIDSVTVKCYGARENATIDSTHMAQLAVYSGSTLKGSAQDFTSTSDSIITLSDVGTWTRAELQNAKLRFTVAYYGGHLDGVTWTVNYTVNNKFYTYTYTVNGDATISVVIGSTGDQDKAYIKVNGTWVQCSGVYKKVNGAWVLQTDLSNVFDSGSRYKLN